MGFGKTFKRINSFGLKRKTVKKIRTKLGLSSKSKWIRQIRKRFRPGTVSDLSGGATSAPSYLHQAKTLSQMTGGV